MRHFLLRVFPFALFLCAQSQASVSTSLPADFFLQDLTSVGFEPIASVLEQSPGLLAVEQRFRANSTDGTLMNLSTFCMASFLAKTNSFPGWALAMKPALPGATSRTILIALLQAPEGKNSLDSSLQWVGFMSVESTKPQCARFVSAKYL